MIPWNPKNASQSIEPACSEIDPTNALPHIPRAGLRELGPIALSGPSYYCCNTVSAIFL